MSDNQIKREWVMLKFDINFVDPAKDINEVSVFVPEGKRYLSAPDTVLNQEGTKGGTCAYALMNLFRVRYGKKFPLTFSKRFQEKTFSDYRKQLTAFTTLRDMYIETSEYLQDYYKVKCITKNVVADFIQRLKTINRLSDLQESNPEEMTLCYHFIKQNQFDDMEEYWRNQLAAHMIKICREVLEKFHLDPDETFHNYMQQAYKEVDCMTLSLDRRARYYRKCLIKLALDTYEFTESSWHPNDGIISLINCLRNNGACVVFGAFGPSSFTKPATFPAEKFGQQDIYTWGDNDYKTHGISIFHAIAITGASKRGEEEYVYFLDPNDDSDVRHGTRYRVKYSRLCQAISNIHSKGLLIEMPREAFHGPFAMHANKYKMSWLQGDCQLLQELLKDSGLNNISCAHQAEVNTVNTQDTLPPLTRSMRP